MNDWISDKLKTILADFKQSWKSWTIWLQMFGLTFLEFVPYLADNIDVFKPYVPSEQFATLAQLFIAAGVILRFRTTKALRDK